MLLQSPLLLNILHTDTSVPEDPVFWVLRDFGDMLSSCLGLLTFCFLCGPVCCS